MPNKFNYGGQAIIEGVMIRGRTAAALAIRRPNGETITNCQPLPTLYTGRLRQVPLIRGIIVLIETLALGLRALMFSANVALEEEGEEAPAEPTASSMTTWLMLPIAMAIAIGVFFIGPLFIIRQVDVGGSLVTNLVEGVIRLGLFLGYLTVVGLMPDMRRVFAYHAAEHMTISAHEHDAPLSVAEIRKYGRLHPRCGTAFLLTVVVVAVLVFAILGAFDPEIWLLVLLRIALIPVIASISYEFIRFNGAHQDTLLGRIATAPGLWLQVMTTRIPDDSQIEVAIEAMEEALVADSMEEPQPAAGSAR